MMSLLYLLVRELSRLVRCLRFCYRKRWSTSLICHSNQSTGVRPGTWSLQPSASLNQLLISSEFFVQEYKQEIQLTSKGHCMCQAFYHQQRDYRWREYRNRNLEGQHNHCGLLPSTSILLPILADQLDSKRNCHLWMSTTPSSQSWNQHYLSIFRIHLDDIFHNSTNVVICYALLSCASNTIVVLNYSNHIKHDILCFNHTFYLFVRYIYVQSF